MSQWYYSAEIMSGPLLALNPKGSLAVVDIYHLINIFMLLTKR